MLNHQVSAMQWRLGTVLLVELVLLFYLPETGKWSDLQSEVYQYWGGGVAASFCLVVLSSVLRRGSCGERIVAGILTVLPSLLLIMITLAIFRLRS